MAEDHVKKPRFCGERTETANKLDKLQSRYDKALENVEKEGNASTSRTRGAERLLSKINRGTSSN
jgi:hypothetical protein